jgi:hypothetical protein
MDAVALWNRRISAALMGDSLFSLSPRLDPLKAILPKLDPPAPRPEPLPKVHAPSRDVSAESAAPAR